MTVLASAAARVSASSDGVLVTRAAAGDHDAFDRLLGPRVEPLYRTALAVLRAEADARDVVQEACIAAWKELPRLRDHASFDAWLGRILINLCRNHLRHRKIVRLREISIEPSGPPGDERPLSGAALAVEGGQAGLGESDAIRRAFSRVKPDARILLVLHHVEERPIAEIAALMGIPEGTVKWRLHEARRSLERTLEAER